MERWMDEDPTRAWKLSLGLFAGFAAFGAGLLALNAGSPIPSVATANVGDCLVIIGVLGKVICGTGVWTLVKD